MKHKIIIFTFLLSSYLGAEDKQIHTSSGVVVSYASSNVLNWDDIPYAMPPIGDLRWKAPIKIDDSDNIILIGAFQRRSPIGGIA